MIEKESSRLNLPILKRDGRLLASRRDPVLEAQSWLNLELQNHFDYDGWIVLGFASGYALKSLLSQGFENVICIEASHELIDYIHLDDDFIECRDHVFAASKILDSQSLEIPSLTKILSAKYRVLRHPLTYTFESGAYDLLQDMLNGRTDFGLRIIAQLKGLVSSETAFKLEPAIQGVLDLSDLNEYVRDENQQIERMFGDNEKHQYALKIANELIRKK